MSKLQSLKGQLLRLRSRRRGERRRVALARAGTALVWILAALFGLDLVFEAGVAARVTLAVIAGGIWLFILVRHCLPWWTVDEPGLEVALLVEKKHGIDNDLVAAIQFETPESSHWGSGQLREAVIDEASRRGSGLDFASAGYTCAPARPWLAALLSSVLLWGGLAAWQTDHARVFVNRLLLGEAQYPTDTRIVRVGLAGRWLDFDGLAGARVALPFGEPLDLEADVEGVIPEQGQVTVKSLTGDLERVLVLDVGDRSGHFRAVLPRLSHPLSVSFRLGDAWTHPVEVEVIPLPVVEVVFEVTPPDYIEATGSPEVPPGSRTFSVDQGSRVSLEVREVNKPLATVNFRSGETEIPLVRSASGSRGSWKLPSSPASPLESLVEPLTFRLEITDQDGLGPESPFSGSIRIRADRPPRVSLAVVTRHVLPRARPSLSFGAVDDHGLAHLELVLETWRDGEQIAENVEAISALEEGSTPRMVRGRHALRLDSRGLRYGDQVRVRLRARDYRGDLEGQVAESQVVTLHVTDERGVLAAMVETDERSARQLEAIIDRQLGIGSSR